MINKKLSEKELIEAASKMRFYSLLSIHAAGSGHPGGSLSIMDITAALYLNIANLDPENPEWEDRDRIIFSAGHKAPAQYAGLALAGFFNIEDMITLRKFNSPFQGHPHAPDLPGIEVSTGSLGQGLSIACGIALSGKLNDKKYRVFCIMGDGEQQEGSIWESAMAAGNYSLNNLIGIVDRNRLQIDGEVDSIMKISPLDQKYRAFGWEVIEIDGHNMREILDAFKKAGESKDKPTLIITNTIKGKGVSFMENKVGWHGVATKDEEELFEALNGLPHNYLSKDKILTLLNRAKIFSVEQNKNLDSVLPKYSKDYWWNKENCMKVKMKPNRDGFGEGIARAGEHPKVITIHADISNSIRISDFEKADPTRENRVINAGIAEQNMMTMAAGLAHEGWIPVVGTYGVFVSGRPWDQIRTTICNDRLNVKIIGAHGGISVGPDGGTHQALEDISLITVLPNMRMGIPCDAEEAKKMFEYMLLEVQGPCYLRLAREATPVVTDENTPFEFGKANTVRYRKKGEMFKEAFDIQIAKDYKNEGEDLSIVVCGPILTEAMRAAYVLKEEFKIECRIINMHTVKPIDEDAIMRAVRETGVILTCEEHQIGGFANLVSGVVCKNKKYSLPFIFDSIGINDKFGVSGNIRELFNAYEISAEFIVQKALKCLKYKI